jgi:hypothetical protein
MEKARKHFNLLAPKKTALLNAYHNSLIRQSKRIVALLAPLKYRNNFANKSLAATYRGSQALSIT